jgi:hypothetical protein
MIPFAIFGSLFMLAGLVWLVRTLAKLKFPPQDFEGEDFEDWNER